jgi:O-antigen/teichoic acid export membrane protein
VRKDFAKNTLFSLGGYGFLIVFNLAFSFFAARALGPAAYGIYTTFFYILLSFTQPINSLQLAVAKEVQREKMTREEANRRFSSTLFVFALAALVLFGGLSPVFQSVYHLPGIWDGIIGGGVIAIWIILTAYRGIDIGRMNFKGYGVNIGFEGFLRAGIGILLILLGFGITGALGVSIISGIIGIIMIILPDFKNAVKSFFKFRLDKNLVKEFVKALVILLPYGLIMNLDLTMVQKVIGGQESGYIAACALFGKNLIALVLVFANVIFSYTLHDRKDTFWMGVLLTILFFIGAVLFSIFAAVPVINLLFGPGYEKVADYLPWYLIMTLPVAILQHIVNYSIAKNFGFMRIFIWVALGALGVVFWFLLTNYPMITFLKASFVSLTIIDGILLAIIYFLSRNKQNNH